MKRENERLSRKKRKRGGAGGPSCHGDQNKQNYLSDDFRATDNRVCIITLFVIFIHKTNQNLSM